MPSWLQFLGQGKRERASFLSASYLSDDALHAAQDLRFLLRADEAVHFPAALNISKAGMLWIRKRAAVTGFSSTLSLATRIRPSNSRANCCTTGPTCRQG